MVAPLWFLLPPVAALNEILAVDTFGLNLKT